MNIQHGMSKEEVKKKKYPIFNKECPRLKEKGKKINDQCSIFNKEFPWLKVKR
jgi:hypothetical protein